MKSMVVSIKSAYGNERIYPACEVAQTFADLIGQKTFTRRDISLIKTLGFEIKVEAPTL